MIQKNPFCAGIRGKETCIMPERVYVNVTSDFDRTGYMQPRLITWPDGRVFRIDEVRAFRPAGADALRDCYTVVIQGKERSLFFERTGEHFSSRLGRWFVDR